MRGGRGAGTKVGDQRAGKLGTWLHYGFGASGGPAAAALIAASGMRPMAAALVVGVGIGVFVDEGANGPPGLRLGKLHEAEVVGRPGRSQAADFHDNLTRLLAVGWPRTIRGRNYTVVGAP